MAAAHALLKVDLPVPGKAERTCIRGSCVDGAVASKAGAIHPRVPNHRTRGLAEINYKRLFSARPGESNAYLEDTAHGDLTRLRLRQDQQVQEWAGL